MLLGRSRVLEDATAAQRMAWKVLAGGVVAGGAIYLQLVFLRSSGQSPSTLRLASHVLTTYSGLAKMAVWVAGCVLLYQGTALRHALALLAPLGRMSLTCYVTQSMIGVVLFYHFGFGLHRQLGPFLSLLVGVALLALQCLCAHGWLRRYRYGPLEWLWRCATYLDFSIPLRRTSTGA